MLEHVTVKNEFEEQFLEGLGKDLWETCGAETMLPASLSEKLETRTKSLLAQLDDKGKSELYELCGALKSACAVISGKLFGYGVEFGKEGLNKAKN